MYGWPPSEAAGSGDLAAGPVPPSVACCPLEGFFAEVEDGHNVWMRAKSAHGLRLAADAITPDVVQAFGLDQREGDVAVEQGVVGEIDLLLAALTEECSYRVAAVGEGCGYPGLPFPRGEGAGG